MKKAASPNPPNKRFFVGVVFVFVCFFFFKWDVPVSEYAKPKCKL